ncbi:hypothetical protein G7081_03320 [Vagococcus coleopterorum]|uniref:Uncharacterized protein n=1 Tax=Vagococcus coleopterorum TaxID=2714946 RepID=A0A6G8AMH2_9ENTE|nr:cell wall synthase accessory phosphoprotein MacP [Vagococcus coleopterorum]QIL46170.1 hypothetical protein G7081_03320 [Vagococcus coleopterorum]
MTQPEERMTRADRQKLNKILNQTESVEEKEFTKKDKKIKKFFSREKKKNKPLEVSRSEEQERIARLSSFLNKAILAVSILLVIVFIAIFYF